MELAKQEKLKVVADDLRFLGSLWDQDVNEESLRRVSPILRKLLVNGELQWAWKTSGADKEPMITGSTLVGLLDSSQLRRIKYAAAGGARYHGAEMRAGTIFNYAMSAEDVSAHHARGVPGEALGLSKYMDAAGMMVDGEPIARRTIVKFIANVLGGVHFGSKQERKSKELRRYRLLDRARKEFMLLGHPCVYFELLSIGQAVVASEDIRQLSARLASISN